MPAMVLQDAADDGETEPGALFAGRHIGFEQTTAVFFRQPDPVVDDVDDDVAAVADGGGPDLAAAERGGRHGGDGFGGVLCDVGGGFGDQAAVEPARRPGPGRPAPPSPTAGAD